MADPRHSKSGWFCIGTGGGFASGMPGGFEVGISGGFDRNTQPAFRTSKKNRT